MCLDLLMITLIVVFIVDVSGVVTTIKKLIWRWLYGKTKSYVDFPFKPFDCDLCATFWVNIIYVLCVDSVTIPILLWIVFLSNISASLCDLFILTREILNWLMGKVFDTLKL